MLGIVPHGTNAVSGMVRGNSPESLIVNKDGAVPRYMAFDYMSPKWQEYLKKVAAFFGSEFQADALRIDLADGSYPNWRTRDDTFVPANVPEQWWRDAQKKGGGKLPPLPYMRASLSRRQGGLEISRAIREGLRSVKPDGAVLGEVQYAPYMTTNDIVYDKELGHFFSARCSLVQLSGKRQQSQLGSVAFTPAGATGICRAGKYSTPSIHRNP